MGSLERRELHHPTMRQPKGAFVHALEVPTEGRVVYVSGLTAQNQDGEIVGVDDMARQAEVVFEQMARLLEVAGGGFDDVVKLTVYTRDMDRWEEVTEERRRRFTGRLPTATMVEVSRFVHPEALLEVEAVAQLGTVESTPPL